MSAYLGSFDVVVEVVAECLDVGNDIVSGLLCEVLWEKNCDSQYISFQNVLATGLPKVTYPISPVPLSTTPGTFCSSIGGSVLYNT